MRNNGENILNDGKVGPKKRDYQSSSSFKPYKPILNKSLEDDKQLEELC